MPTPFTIYIKPQKRVDRCNKRQEEESRGLFCHNPRCQECTTVLEGFALWGENGFLQGVFHQQERPTDSELALWSSRDRYGSKFVFVHKEHGFTYVGK